MARPMPLVLPVMCPGRPYGAISPVCCEAPSALTMHDCPASIAASTSSFEAMSDGSRRAVNIAGAGCRETVSIGRPSAVQAAQPPSSTRALVNPKARSIHQMRAAHMFPERS